MGVEVSYKIEGLKELSKGIKDLSASFQRSTMRTAMRGAIRPVVRDAKANVAVDTGDLKKSLIGKARVSKVGHGEAALIARRGGKFRGWHAHFEELGTSQRAARPFMRPAFDRAIASGAIVGSFVQAINRTIERRLAKAGVVIGRFEDVDG